jgi:hypothetical protein
VRCCVEIVLLLTVLMWIVVLWSVLLWLVLLWIVLLLIVLLWICCCGFVVVDRVVFVDRVVVHHYFCPRHED